ncbi:hypothetical protein GE09DRAFT_472655 [Coniochaeta sp. 2T2.1]|nr:hypothetical protein GE09DRAFT_472655 [Coniochaeta sp. 2T2.1]
MIFWTYPLTVVARVSSATSNELRRVVFADVEIPAIGTGQCQSRHDHCRKARRAHLTEQLRVTREANLGRVEAGPALGREGEHRCRSEPVVLNQI